MLYFKHPQAIVETNKISENTRIWAFTHILPDAVIGSDCNICDHVFIENDVHIGNRVTIKCGVQLWDGLTVENDVFIGPNVTFTNDNFPRSKQYPKEFLKTIIREGASIGANATILAGLIIGKKAMIGAGAVVTKNVPPNAIIAGNPAEIIGYTSTIDSLTKKRLASERISEIKKPKVEGVQIINLPIVPDLRGSLSFAQVGDQLPFIPKRYFIVFDVKSKEIRGEHAHYKLKQFLVCIKGTCSLVVDDGINREEYILDQPNIGVYIPPMVWGIQYKYSKDALLLVLASECYDSEDYIRDYDNFLKLVSQK